MVRRIAPIFIPIDAVVDHQITSENFSKHPLPFETSPGDRFQGVNTRGVNQIERHPKHFRYANGPIGGFAFYLWGSGKRMTFGSVNSLFINIFLQTEYQFSVFCVHRTQGAQFSRPGGRTLPSVYVVSFSKSNN